MDTQNLNLQKIGFFQFENLIHNRIPFLLIHFGQDLRSLFMPHHLTLSQAQLLDGRTFLSSPSWAKKNLLGQLFLPADLAKLFSDIQSKEIPLHSAVVILSEDEKEAEFLLKEFLKKGFGNSFLVQGGMKAMSAEAAKEKENSPR